MNFKIIQNNEFGMNPPDRTIIKDYCIQFNKTSNLAQFISNYYLPTGLDEY
jgi:hypothetical protein